MHTCTYHNVDTLAHWHRQPVRENIPAGQNSGNWNLICKNMKLCQLNTTRTWTCFRRQHVRKWNNPYFWSTTPLCVCWCLTQDLISMFRHVLVRRYIIYTMYYVRCMIRAWLSWWEVGCYREAQILVAMWKAWLSWWEVGCYILLAFC